MITYEPPEQEEVSVGDHVEGIGTVVDPDDLKVTEPPQRPTAEFYKLIKDAPRFHAMGNGELIAYAYGIFAAGKKIEAENAKLVELLLKSFELMHRGGLTTGAYGPCMELFDEAEDIGVIVPFMSELRIEVS